ncbi:hypothetical protein [Kiloniella antarctica]|uniref:Solute-binding protein family 3/N-terminal domain-containing protein n=1 Tax=Kiloniella antarctica TaxID=1550907 RepID=A0ABW5BJF8_9PROT
MLNINKIILKVLMCLGCGALLFFIHTATAEDVAHNKETTKELRLRIGVIFPPYFMAKNLNGRGQRGAEIDIITEALAFEDYRITIVDKDQKAFGDKTEINLGLNDIEMSMPVGNELGVCYSKPYIYYRNAAMSLSSRRLIVDGIDDLEGRRVTGIQSAVDLMGANFANLLSDVSGFGEVRGHQEQSVLLFDGISDFVVGEVNIFNWLVDNRLILEQRHEMVSIAIHPIFNPSPKHLVFRDPLVCLDFNHGLNRLKESGRYQEILSAYDLE